MAGANRTELKDLAAARMAKANRVEEQLNLCTAKIKLCLENLITELTEERFETDAPDRPYRTLPALLEGLPDDLEELSTYVESQISRIKGLLI